MALLLVGAVFTPSSLEAGTLAGSRPNIIIVMPDDASYGLIQAYGGMNPTPNLDHLYHKSLRFEDFHVSPTCSPTRAAMLTGRHECYAGVTHTINMRERMSLQSRTLANMLSDAGYATGIFGKWHLGDEEAYRCIFMGQEGSGKIMTTRRTIPTMITTIPFCIITGNQSKRPDTARTCSLARRSAG